MFYLKLTFTLVVCLTIFFIGKAWFKTKKSNSKSKDSNQSKKDLDVQHEAPKFVNGGNGGLVYGTIHDSITPEEPIAESKKEFVKELESVNAESSVGTQSSMKFENEFDKDSIIESVNRAKKNLHPVYNKNVTRDSKGRFISKKK
jgi:hypothetical protein